MADNNCKIRMVMKQEAGPETYKESFSYEGHFASRDGSFLLKYDEPTEDGINKVVVKYSYGIMTMKKEGQYKSLMVFDPNEITSSEYMTPAGNLPLDIETKKLTVTADGDGAVLHAKYNLKSQGQLIAKNELKINIFVE